MYRYILRIFKVKDRYFYTAAADLSFYRLDQMLTVWEGKPYLNGSKKSSAASGLVCSTIILGVEAHAM